MTLLTGDVVLIWTRFQQTEGPKIRPAIVLLDTGDDDFVAAPVTSQPQSTEYDLAMFEWRLAGLNVPSSGRLHKLAVLSKSDVVRKLGAFSVLDRDALRAALCQAFCLK